MGSLYLNQRRQKLWAGGVIFFFLQKASIYWDFLQPYTSTLLCFHVVDDECWKYHVVFLVCFLKEKKMFNACLWTYFFGGQSALLFEAVVSVFGVRLSTGGVAHIIIGLTVWI